MTGTNSSTHADDCERMLRILSDAPSGGLSIEAIHAITEKHPGDRWSFRTINTILLGLGSQVAHAKVRERHSKVTKYFLRTRS
jgi:hypothetical protein